MSSFQFNVNQWYRGHNFGTQVSLFARLLQAFEDSTLPEHDSVTIRLVVPFITIALPTTGGFGYKITTSTKDSFLHPSSFYVHERGLLDTREILPYTFETIHAWMECQTKTTDRYEPRRVLAQAEGRTQRPRALLEFEGVTKFDIRGCGRHEEDEDGQYTVSMSLKSDPQRGFHIPEYWFQHNRLLAIRLSLPQ